MRGRIRISTTGYKGWNGLKWNLQTSLGELMVIVLGSLPLLIHTGSPLDTEIYCGVRGGGANPYYPPPSSPNTERPMCVIRKDDPTLVRREVTILHDGLWIGLVVASCRVYNERGCVTRWLALIFTSCICSLLILIFAYDFEFAERFEMIVL